MANEKMFTINGSEYLFVNMFRGNRSGFVHETELMANNWIIATNKIQYYNRTWEAYTYQSVMKGAVRKAMEDIKASYVEAWKINRNVKRLTEAKRKIMEEDFANNMPEMYAELKELYTML